MLGAINTPSYEYGVYKNAVTAKLQAHVVPVLAGIIAEYAGVRSAFEHMTSAQVLSRGEMTDVMIASDARNGRIAFPECASALHSSPDIHAWAGRNQKERVVHAAPLDARVSSAVSIVVTDRSIVNASTDAVLVDYSVFNPVIDAVSDPAHSFLLVALEYGDKVGCTAYRLQAPGPVKLRDLTLNAAGETLVNVDTSVSQSVALSATSEFAVVMYVTDVLNFRIVHLPTFAAVTTVTLSGIAPGNYPRIALGFSSFILVQDQILVCQFGQADKKAVVKGK